MGDAVTFYLLILRLESWKVSAVKCHSGHSLHDFQIQVSKIFRRISEETEIDQQVRDTISFVTKVSIQLEKPELWELGYSHNTTFNLHTWCPKSHYLQTTFEKHSQIFLIYNYTFNYNKIHLIIYGNIATPTQIGMFFLALILSHLHHQLSFVQLVYLFVFRSIKWRWKYLKTLKHKSWAKNL